MDDNSITNASLENNDISNRSETEKKDFLTIEPVCSGLFYFVLQRFIPSGYLMQTVVLG